MSRPHKHIAEGIAAAIMVGVGGERGARRGDRWQFGEVYMHVGGHALPNENSTSPFTLTSLHGRRCEVASEEPLSPVGRRSSCNSNLALVRVVRQIVDPNLSAEAVERLLAALKPKPVSARLVQTTYPSPRCCAPGCGDKIKGGDMYEITWNDGVISHLEGSCVDWFVNGHPDYGGGRGHVDGLPS